MVSTSYPSTSEDWRGQFILRLSEALSRHADLSLRSWAPPGPQPPGAINVATQEESLWLGQLMTRGGIAHLLRRNPVAGILAAARLLRFERHLFRRQSDTHVYHLNWLQNALALPNDGRPLLATVLGTDMQLLKVPLMKAMLSRVMSYRTTMLCPNAEWMVAPLSEHFGKLAKVEFVPFGIDPAWFTVERQQTSDVRQWLCVSRVTKNKIGTLFEWGQTWFSTGDRVLHLFGPMQEELAIPPWVRYHGPVAPATLIDQWFPQATGLISLSQHSEGRPQIMLEAMAAGVPIVASAIAAHRNLIGDQRNGWICERADQLGDILSTAETSSNNVLAGKQARQWALDQIGTWDDCANRYVDRYHRLFEGTQ